MADDDKKKEILYVRAEKAADEAITEKLVKIYGAARPQEQTRRSRQSWKCKECAFVNYDCRYACGNCLSVSGVGLLEKVNLAMPLPDSRSLAEPHVKVVTRMGRSYRVWADTSAPTRPVAAAAPPTHGVPHYEEDDLALGEEDDDPGCTVTRDKATGNIVLTWAVPSQYNKFIIGAKGQTLADIQRTTGATVLIQSQDGVNKIVVRATAIHCIRAAKLRIEIIIAEFKDRVAYTHFVSIPLGTLPSLQQGLRDLMASMKGAMCNPDRRIDEKLFQRPSRVHLTLLMLRLYSDADREKCVAIMRDVQTWISEEFTPMDEVHLRRLNYMNDDPSLVNVLYLEVAPNPARDKLLRLIDRVNQAFMASGLSQPKDVEHNEKMHATVMNSKWRAPVDGDASRIPFDITDVLTAFGEVDLGTHRLQRMDVSVLGPDDEGVGADDAYYTAMHSVTFPRA